MRTHYAALTHAEMSAKILSDLADSTLEYTVEYEYNKEDNDLLTVTAPEALAGVQLTLSGSTPDTFVLQYADASLDFQMDGAVRGLTPADAIGALFSDLGQGEPTECARERVRETPVLCLKYETLDQQPAVAKSVWLRENDLAPVCAELFQDGRKLLTLFFQQYQE